MDNNLFLLTIMRAMLLFAQFKYHYVNLINISMGVYNWLCSKFSGKEPSEFEVAIASFKSDDEAIPRSLHVHLFNEECCSEKTLNKYIEMHDLEPNAELLLFDKYKTTKPEIITKYISRWYPSTVLQIKIFESEIFELIYALCRKSSNSKLSDETEMRLVEMNNPELFRLFLSNARKLSSEKAINALLDKMDLEMLTVFTSFHCKVVLSCEQEWKFLNSGNENLFNLALKLGKYKIQDSNFIQFLENNNTEILSKYLANQLCVKQDTLLIKSRNQEMIMKYLEKFPLSKDAQIELVKLDDRDTLRYHFDKYGISRETMAYYAHMRMFKDYIGVV